MQGIKRSSQDMTFGPLISKKSYEVHKTSLKSQPSDIENYVNASTIVSQNEQSTVKPKLLKKTLSSIKSIEKKDSIVNPVHTSEFFNVDENNTKSYEDEIMKLKEIINNERKLRIESESRIKELTKELNETKSTLNYYITLYDCAKITINDLEQKIQQHEEELKDYEEEREFKEFMRDIESQVKREYDENDFIIM